MAGGHPTTRIPVAPKKKPSSSSGTRYRAPARSSGKKKKRGGGGGGGGYDPRAAERRAIARENKAKAKAAARYRAQAKTLGLQEKALKKALTSGFQKALDIRLGNVSLLQGQRDKQITEGYEDRVDMLEKGAKENEASGTDQTYANLQNRSRERQAAVSNALLHGAGESDVLKAHTMSLRSWQANQSEVNRSFFDSLNSINSSLNDLNVDTKTARLNAESDANSDRDQLWTEFFNRKSEGYTQLGNIQGQKAELYGMAQEQKSGSSGDQKRESKASGKSFNQASEYASKAWKNPGNSQGLLEWKGEKAFAGHVNNVRFNEQSPAIPEAKKPEGATLRAWA